MEKLKAKIFAVFMCMVFVFSTVFSGNVASVYAQEEFEKNVEAIEAENEVLEEAEDDQENEVVENSEDDQENEVVEEAEDPEEVLSEDINEEINIEEDEFDEEELSLMDLGIMLMSEEPQENTGRTFFVIEGSEHGTVKYKIEGGDWQTATNETEITGLDCDKKIYIKATASDGYFCSGGYFKGNDFQHDFGGGDTESGDLWLGFDDCGEIEVRIVFELFVQPKLSVTFADTPGTGTLEYVSGFAENGDPIWTSVTNNISNVDANAVRVTSGTLRTETAFKAGDEWLPKNDLYYEYWFESGKNYSLTSVSFANPTNENSGKYKVSLTSEDGVSGSVILKFLDGETVLSTVTVTSSNDYIDIPSGATDVEIGIPQNLRQFLSGSRMFGYGPFSNGGSEDEEEDGLEFDRDNYEPLMRRIYPGYSYHFEFRFSKKKNVRWRYAAAAGVQADEIVEHAKIYLLEDDNPEHKKDGMDFDLLIGDTYYFLLVPDYGYQISTIRINDIVDLIPMTSAGVFKFTMVNSNLHFRGIVTNASDQISVSGEAVSGATIQNGGNAVSSGNVKLTVGDTSLDDSAAEVVSGEGIEAVASVNIGLKQIISKGGNRGNWESDVNDFANPVSISLDVNPANLASGETYSIVRNHNGNKTELHASYNAQTGKLTFASNQFSTYTIVKKIKPIEDNQNNNTDSASEEAAKIEQKAEEEVKQEVVPVTDIAQMTLSETVKTVIQDIVNTITNAIENLVKPDATNQDKTETTSAPVVETFDLSNFATDKGYESAMLKVAEKYSATADKKESTANAKEPDVIALYTGDRVCMSKNVATAWNNCKEDVVWIFSYKGKLYKITIPKGTDITSLMGTDQYVGPLYIGSKLGTTEEVK